MSWRSAVSKNLQELRFHLCNDSKGSEGLRQFITNSYTELKKANPLFPFLVRERKDIDAKITARYDFGVEETVVVENMTMEQISKQIEDLVSKGVGMPRSTESMHVTK